ncbi:hypothetical protein T4E_9815 [Trichinella pseudospiralis]|uniref:Uncharacterized protein n=1 Tax=Trichinella pseudospiralis TaxID=6337 RepID=A0A0V0XR22_TRIPS|nr:hypothetical protein T4E_9815 [Trichinella pseudospiralis]
MVVVGGAFPSMENGNVSSAGNSTSGYRLGQISGITLTYLIALAGQILAVVFIMAKRRVFAALYDTARYTSRPFGEDELDRFVRLYEKMFADVESWQDKQEEQDAGKLTSHEVCYSVRKNKLYNRLFVPEDAKAHETAL